MKREHINFLLNDGGIGDQIARLPVFLYIFKYFPHVIQHIWVPDYAFDLYRNILPRDKSLLVKPYSRGEKEYNQGYPGKRTATLEHTNMGSHLTDHAFHVLADKTVENQYKNYPSLKLDTIDITSFSLPKKYVVITTGYTAAVREMLPEVINALSDYVLARDYIPVYLGSKAAPVGGNVKEIIGNFREEVDYRKGIDLINATTLLQAGKIIARAQCIVGLDNGLIHLAGCTSTPIVAGYTTVAPLVRMPYRNDVLGYNCFPVVPDSILPCRFCQSNWEWVFDHDFRKCFYKEKGYDKTIQCVKNLTADKYINRMSSLL